MLRLEVSLPPDLYEYVCTSAARDCVSASVYVRQILARQRYAIEARRNGGAP